MKKSHRFIVFLLFCAGLFISCSQDPVFFEISNEVEPKDPRIMGGPSNAVEFKGSLYVASGFLYRYNALGWASLPAPGNIKSLAVTAASPGAADAGLYALAFTGSGLDAALWKSPDGFNWGLVANLTGYAHLQSIFGAGDALFVGARSIVERNAILYLKEGEAALTLLREFDQGGDLKGAAYFDNQYYAATTNRGIFAGATPEALGTAAWLPNSFFPLYDINFSGLITVGTTSIAAVTRNGHIWMLKAGAGQVPVITTPYGGSSFTGALAVWRQPGGAGALLLLGAVSSGSSGVYGYREIPLVNGELELVQLTPYSPGQLPFSTTSNNPRYNSTIGNHVINSLIQVSPAVDPGMILFASTQKDGFWSCRADVWNAEE
jgi:hypothetical protein